MTKAKLLLCAAALVVAAAPAMARDERGKTERTPPVRSNAEQMMSPMVAEPGDKATAPVPPSLVGRAYMDAVRRDADHQLNRGY